MYSRLMSAQRGQGPHKAVTAEPERGTKKAIASAPRATPRTSAAKASIDSPAKVRSFWNDPPWWFREGLLALLIAGIIGGITVAVQKDVDDRRSDRESAAAKLLADQTDEANKKQSDLARRLENQRFVRERSAKDIRDRPFENLDLTELGLSGLSLRGADFRMAKMKSTVLRDSDLRGADFAHAEMDLNTDFNSSDLTGAAIVRVGGDVDPMVGNFYNSKLIHAKLIGISFTDLGPADLSGAMLQNADLSHVDLSAVKLDGACYDNSTGWPTGFTPPPTGDPNTCELNHLKDFFSARNEPIPDYYFQPRGPLPRS